MSFCDRCVNDEKWGREVRGGLFLVETRKITRNTKRIISGRGVGWFGEGGGADWGRDGKSGSRMTDSDGMATG